MSQRSYVLFRLDALAKVIDAIDKKLDRVLDSLHLQKQETLTMAQNLEDLKAAVAAQRTVVDGAITLLNGIASRVDAAATAAKAGDEAALPALTDAIRTETADLSKAITDNTPSSSPPATTTVVVPPEANPVAPVAPATPSEPPAA